MIITRSQYMYKLAVKCNSFIPSEKLDNTGATYLLLNKVKQRLGVSYCVTFVLLRVSYPSEDSYTRQQRKKLMLLHLQIEVKQRLQITVLCNLCTTKGFLSFRNSYYESAKKDINYASSTHSLVEGHQRKYNSLVDKGLFLTFCAPLQLL